MAGSYYSGIEKCLQRSPLLLISIYFMIVMVHCSREFDRSSVEYEPPQRERLLVTDYTHYYNYTMSKIAGKSPEFGAGYLPLRMSVERIPTTYDRAEEHYPLRDAVERVPLHPFPGEQKIENVNYRNKESRRNPYRMVCYVASWSYYRRSRGMFTPENLNPDLCTHIVYAFASLHPDNFTIVPADPVTDLNNGFYEKITSKQIKKKAKVMIAIGGWTDSVEDKYSRLVSNGANRQRFVKSVIAFLRRYGFDGLHLDWIYPVCWQARCSADNLSDKTNYVKLVQELRGEFNKHDPSYQLAVAVAGYKEVIDVGYDILDLSDSVDFLSVMTYDYHGAWESTTEHLSPLYQNDNSRFPQYNTDTTMAQLVLLGAEPSKLLLGVPLYGQSYTLASAEHHDIGDSSVDLGEYGEYTQQPGILAYYEICQRVKNNGWTLKRARDDGTEPYAYKGRQWVGFEDPISLQTKAEYVKKHGFGGVMIWTVDLDDFNNECCYGSYPLLRTLNAAFGHSHNYPSKNNCEKPPLLSFETGTTTTTGETSSVVEEWMTVPSTSKVTTTTISSTRPTTSSPPSSLHPVHPTRPWWPPSLTPRPRPQKPHGSSTASSTAMSSTTMAMSSTTVIPSTTSSSTAGFILPISPVTDDIQVISEEKDCISGMYYGDPEDCTVYYYCVFGRKKRQHCAPGLHWNLMTNLCDWPRSAKCTEKKGGKQTRTPVKFSNLLSTETSLKTDSTNGAAISVTMKADATNVSVTVLEIDSGKNLTGVDIAIQGGMLTSVVHCSQHGEIYPVPGDCSGYYICDRGKLINRRCPNGHRWNQMSKSCRRGGFSSPCISATPVVSRNQKVKAASGCDQGQYLPHTKSCEKYLQCMWGEYREASCPRGLYWNEKLYNCDWAGNVVCNKPGNGNDVEEEPSSTWTSSTASSSTTPHVTMSTENSGWYTTQTTRVTSNSPDHHTVPSSTMVTYTTRRKPTTTTSEWEWHPTFQTVTLPTERPRSPLSGYYKVVCYFTNWAWYRPGTGKFFPEDVNPNLCTHVIYGFSVLDHDSLVIKMYDSWADGDNKFYERVVALQARGLKVLVAIGGWNDSAGDKYSRLVNNPAARKRFVSSVLQFLEKYGFDGLDFDWEYPKCWQVNCNRGPSSDKEGFSALLRELREAFNPHGYLLSAAVSPSKTVIDAGYEVKELSTYLDWISVMTYDYHGQWDKKTGHLAPIYYIPGDEFDYFNINYTINYWLQKGADARKLIMGIPLYGQGFSIANTSNTGLNSPSSGPAEAGEYTRAAGFLSYYEICDRVLHRGWTVVEDEQHRRGPYAYKGSQWVGYDDVRTIKQKVDIIRKLNLGGGMIWALDLDDFHNTCGQGYYPLLTTIANGLAEPGGYGEHWMFPENEHFWGSTSSTTPESSFPPVTVTSSSTITSSVTHVPTILAELSSQMSTTTIEVTSTTPSSTTPMKEVRKDHFKVVCYFTNWAWYRQGNGKYYPSDIDEELCTHIIYGFAVLDSAKLIIKPHDTWADLDNSFYQKVTSLKKRGLKVLLAIGGWNDSAGNKYSRLVNDAAARQRFVNHVVQFLHKYNFDGLDVDWEYPKCWQVNCKKGPDSDKQAFSALITELREAFTPHQLLLTAAVSPNKVVIDEGYDVPLLSEKLDWISVMAYDYHGQWDKKTGHVAPMYLHPLDDNPTFNTNFTIYYWVEKGADPRKIVLGMPMYGQSFTLSDTRNNSLNAPSYGGGDAGEYTRSRGFIAYYEICERIQKRGWEVIYDIEGRIGPYARHGTQWVSFDDQPMIRHKSEYVFYNDLGGAMIWALDLDDFRNVCGCGRYPLLKTINKVLRNYTGEVQECYLEPDRYTSRLQEEQRVITAEEDIWRYGACVPGEMKRHPTDCSKYISCAYGTYEQLHFCPSGLHFSTTTKVCDWPNRAGCSLTKIEESQKEDISLNRIESDYKVVCYLTNWAAYRYNATVFLKQVLEQNLCTHLVYGFLMLNEDQLTVTSKRSLEENDKEFFDIIKSIRKNVKILVALGGWYDSLDDKYGRMFKDADARKRFISNAATYLRRRNVDGMEIHREFPRCLRIDCRKQLESEKGGFAELVEDMSIYFKKHNMILSVAVSPDKDIIRYAYDIPRLSSYAAWLSLMSYDYHGHWDNSTGHIAPLYKNNDQTSIDLSVDSSVSYLLDNGCPRDKLILGLPAYGQSFRLSSPWDINVDSQVEGPGDPAPYTRVPGFISYYEICDIISNGGWTVVKESGGTYMYSKNQWISYNDVTDIAKKGVYVKYKELGGAALWSLDLDDFTGICGCGTYPLLSVVNEELRNYYYREARVLDCTQR